MAQQQRTSSSRHSSNSQQQQGSTTPARRAAPTAVPAGGPAGAAPAALAAAAAALGAAALAAALSAAAPGGRASAGAGAALQKKGRRRRRQAAAAGGGGQGRWRVGGGARPMRGLACTQAVGAQQGRRRGAQAGPRVELAPCAHPALLLLPRWLVARGRARAVRHGALLPPVAGEGTAMGHRRAARKLLQSAMDCGGAMRPADRPKAAAWQLTRQAAGRHGPRGSSHAALDHSALLSALPIGKRQPGRAAPLPQPSAAFAKASQGLQRAVPPPLLLWHGLQIT